MLDSWLHAGVAECDIETLSSLWYPRPSLHYGKGRPHMYAGTLQAEFALMILHIGFTKQVLCVGKVVCISLWYVGAPHGWLPSTDQS